MSRNRRLRFSLKRTLWLALVVGVLVGMVYVAQPLPIKPFELLIVGTVAILLFGSKPPGS
jgi:xanthosine utilization system XapX-like protein